MARSDIRIVAVGTDGHLTFVVDESEAPKDQETLTTSVTGVQVDVFFVREVCRLAERALRLWDSFVFAVTAPERAQTDEVRTTLKGAGKTSGAALMECAEKILEKQWPTEHGPWDKYINSLDCEDVRLTPLVREFFTSVMFAVYVRFDRIEPKAASDEESGNRMLWAMEELKRRWRYLVEAMKPPTELVDNALPPRDETTSRYGAFDRTKAMKAESRRLDVDEDTQSVTLDGQTATIKNPRAFKFFQLVSEAKGSCVPSEEIRSKIRGAPARLDRLIKELPDWVQDLIKSKRGWHGGYSIALPIQGTRSDARIH
jgi:hypothetical protein